GGEYTSLPDTLTVDVVNYDLENMFGYGSLFWPVIGHNDSHEGCHCYRDRVNWLGLHLRIKRLLHLPARQGPSGSAGVGCSGAYFIDHHPGGVRGILCRDLARLLEIGGH